MRKTDTKSRPLREERSEEDPVPREETPLVRDAGNSDDPHPTRGPSATQPVQSASSSYWFQFILVPVQSDSSFIPVQSDSSLNQFILWDDFGITLG